MRKPFRGRITRRQFTLGSSSALFLISSPFWEFRSVAAAVANNALSPDARADALLVQMTLDEKIALLHGVSFNRGTTGYVGDIPANTRLAIPALHLEDGPGGVADNVPLVTAFPAPISGAASWDIALMKQYSQALGAEEYGKGANILLGPTVNILRIPQWGRSFESLGEDPYLTSQIAVAEIQGMQSQHIIATVKHFAANNQEFDRTSASSNVDERTLQEIYLPAFKAAVEQGNVGAVMGSYNKVNGTYACENPYLIETVLHEQTGFKGFLVSDWGANHSAVAAANAGLDMEMPLGSFFSTVLTTAVQNEQVSIATIDDKVHRILRTMFATGLFDYPGTGVLTSNVETTAHTQLARQVAEQGAVLLKNDQHILPLNNKNITSIAVIGTDASTSPKAVGGGSASVVAPYIVSPLVGITSRAGTGITVQYADGSDQTETIQLAQAADVALVFVNDIESEGSDRSSLSLPNNQDQLIATVAQVNPHTIVVINTGAPVLMPWVDQVQGIIEAWYSGQEDGNAIAAILFGDINPSGKLPITFPASASDVPASTVQQYPGIDDQVSYSEGIFVGYRHYDTHNISPLFAFGHGLSYTTFAYKHLLVLPGDSSSEKKVLVSVDITNTGSRAGAEVVQLYLGIPSTNVPEPPKQLKGFEKVFLNPGQSKQVTFSLNSQDLSYWDVNVHGWVVQKGSYKVMIGSSSRDIRVSNQFFVSRTDDPVFIIVQTPETVQPGSINTITTPFTNKGDFTIQDVHLNLQTPSGWTARPRTWTTFEQVRAGQTVQIQWQVVVPTSTQPGNYILTAQANFQSRRGKEERQNTATTAIAYPSLSLAFNNVGITDDSNTVAGAFASGFVGGQSYSAEALAQVGLTPGSTITHNGVSFVWPNVTAGQPDNVRLASQLIDFSGSGKTLAFLGASDASTQSGAVTITYTDGSTQQLTLVFASWSTNSAASGTDILTTAPYSNMSSSSNKGQPVSIYFASVSLQAGKTIRALRFSTNGNLHVFASGMA